jgi:hypothetical protein
MPATIAGRLSGDPIAVCARHKIGAIAGGIKGICAALRRNAAPPVSLPSKRACPRWS